MDTPPPYSKDPMPGESSLNDCSFPSAPPESIISYRDDQDLTYENYQLQASSCVPFDVSFLVNEGLHETDYLVAEMLENLRGPATWFQKLREVCGAKIKKRSIVSVTVSWIWKFCITTTVMTLDVKNEAKFFRNLSGNEDIINIYMALNAEKKDQIFPFWGSFTNVDIMYDQREMKFSKTFLDECGGFCVLSKQVDASEKMQPISEHDFSFN